jgi:lon-related putative ATP-dependent protease
MVKELTYQECSHLCPETAFECKTTADIIPNVAIVGQDRALKALNFGLAMPDPRFNIFISGPSGTGRSKAVSEFLRDVCASLPTPADWCYVNNFKEPSRPKAIDVDPGAGKVLKRLMDRFAQDLLMALPRAFESEDYAQRRAETVKKAEEEQRVLIQQATDMARKKGFTIQPTPQGIQLTPIKSGIPFLGNSPADEAETERKKAELELELRQSLRPLIDIGRSTEAAMEKLNKEVVGNAVGPLLTELRDTFKKNPKVLQYLDEVMVDVLENLPALLMQVLPQLMQQQAQGQDGRPAIPVDHTKSYRVNLLVDNSELKGAPNVHEPSPTFTHLFGFSEKEVRFGALNTDFTMIQSGSMHRANGGFIVIQAERLLADMVAYDTLKRTIQTRKLTIEDVTDRYTYIVTKSLRPEPIPFQCKVILFGNPESYQILYHYDPDFRELFKVKAEFDRTMERDDVNIQRYSAFVCTLCNSESLLHLDPSGMGALVEYSSRLADDKDKLSTQFSDMADAVREASFYAKQDGENKVSRKHIERQMDERIYRSNLLQKKIQEMIENGTILVDTDGEEVGQINGLAVLSLGDYMFGQPSRITATVAPGKDGVLDIERQAQMGGPTHTKGVLILTGYLNQMYAQDRPLSLTARLVFEQSYSGVDGDSASSTELYALLSALSGRPIKQYLAVTGSVNQKGQVQAIGGQNQKIEGFFEVCKVRGLNGRQGCLVPKSNVRNLMLKPEVLDAVQEGKFHIYPIESIDEGIEVLTGVKAGKRLPDGSYEPGTIHDLVQRRLSEMAEKVKEFRP